MVDEKQASRDKLATYLYPLPQFGASGGMAFFSSYLAMLLTDIYMLPVVLAGALETIRGILGWIFGPVFGLLLDRVSSKTGKYWKLLAIGTIVGTGANAMTFILPSMSDDPSTLAFPVFILGVLMAVFGSFSGSVLNTIFPKLSTDPQVRSYLAVGQKLGRDGGKTLWGLIVPPMLTYFIAAGGSEAAGWASMSYVIGIFGIAINLVYAFILKGSSLEKEDVVAGPARKKVPLSVVFKTLFQNKALLAMFTGFTIHKIYYFFQILTATYYFRYVVGDLNRLGFFMTAFNLSAVVGSFFGGTIWIRIWKDSKKAFVASGAMHVIFLAILTMVIKTASITVFLLFVALASFFAGALEAYLMPMFAAAADWHAWKTGERSDGITMAVYGLTVRCSTTISTIIRTALLAAAGYDAAAYAQGAAPSEAVLGLLRNFQALYPMLMGVVAFAIVQIFFPITDKKLAKIHEEIKAGRVGEARNEEVVANA
ncbi:MAG: MFS transporter [Firmicutes bacterium]|nr:MFS transporter [Bacillota bacterium]